MFDVYKEREKFPALFTKMNSCPLIYFDNAATTQKPKSVVDALLNFYYGGASNVDRSVHTLANNVSVEYALARETVRQYLNAKFVEEIVFVHNSTEAVNLLANTVGKLLKQGEKILVTAIEHHSNFVPWQKLSAERGFVLNILPLDVLLDTNLLEGYLQNVKLISLTHVSNLLGVVIPVKEIVAIAHRFGTKVIVDGSQYLPHREVDLVDLDVDCYFFSGHKCYAPNGVAVLYVKKDFLEELPPYNVGGGTVSDVTTDGYVLHSYYGKFEAGTPNIPSILGLAKALNYLSTIDFCIHSKLLLDRLTSQLKELKGLSIYGLYVDKVPIVSFSVKGIHPLDIATLLSCKGVAIRSGTLCAQPLVNSLGLESICRVSLAFYNTLEEVDIFCALLGEVLNRLR